MLGMTYTEGSLACQLQRWHSQELLECATIGLHGRSTSSGHWLSCPFKESLHVRNVTTIDGNSSDEVFFCFHNGFMPKITWPHVSGFLLLGAHELPGICNRCGNRRLPRRYNYHRWWYHCGHTRNLRTDVRSMVRQWSACITGQGSRIRAVPMNATAVISVQTYLLCKSS